MKSLLLAAVAAVSLLGAASSALAAVGDPPYPHMSRGDVEQCSGDINALFQRVGNEQITFFQSQIQSYEPGGAAYERSHNESWWEGAKTSDVANDRENIQQEQAWLANTDPVTWFMTGISACEDGFCLDAIDDTYGAGDNFDHVRNFAAGLDYNGGPDSGTFEEQPAVDCIARVYMEKYNALHAGDVNASIADANSGTDTGSADQTSVAEAAPQAEVAQQVDFEVVQQLGQPCMTMRQVKTTLVDGDTETDIEIRNGCATTQKYKADLATPAPGQRASFGLGTIWISMDTDGFLHSWPVGWSLPIQQMGFTPIDNRYDTLKPGGVATSKVIQLKGEVHGIFAIIASCDAVDDNGRSYELYYDTDFTQFKHAACIPIPNSPPGT